MSISLRNLTIYMFRTIYERSDKYNKLKPYFYRFIGTDNSLKYNDYIKTLESKCNEEKDKCIIFDGSIPLSGEMELIQYIFNELASMDIYKMTSQEIVIFNNSETNFKFLNALEYIISIACKKENFLNENVRNNFITKLIVWAYTYAKNIQYDDSINPKCIYYGNIQRHEIYFLILLYKMGYDVIYINPLKEEFWDEIDSDGLSECIKEMEILSIESFRERANKGEVINNFETITKQIQRDIENELFLNTGVFKPWQFRSGYTKSVLLDTILEDIYIYWNEPAKLRPGFKVEDMVVTVPSIFYKIDGQYCSIAENQKILKHCLNAPNTLFFNGGNISRDISLSNDMFELMFCQLSDGTFDVEEIKKSRVYTLGKYNEELQDLLLNKFNQFIKENKILKMSFDKKLSLKLLALILYLNESIIRIIDNFDFVFSIPKIVIYLNGEDTINEWMVILLCYLHNIGIDIVIFNPSGSFNINKYIKEDKIVINRLEEMRYDCKFDEIINYKQSFFSRIMNK